MLEQGTKVEVDQGIKQSDFFRNQPLPTKKLIHDVIVAEFCTVVEHYVSPECEGKDRVSVAPGNSWFVGGVWVPGEFVKEIKEQGHVS